MANGFFTNLRDEGGSSFKQGGHVGSHSILSIIGSDGEGTRRRAIRSRVLLAATLATSTKEVRVRMRDVSSYGARVEGDDLPPRGTAVVLRRGAFEMFGQIVWAGERAIGIAFDEQVEEEELLVRLRGLAEPEQPAPYRRGGFGRELDPPRLSTGDGWLRSLPGRA